MNNFDIELKQQNLNLNFQNLELDKLTVTDTWLSRRSILLVLSELGENSTLVLEVVEVTLFLDLAFLENEDLAALLNGTHPVRNDDRRSVCHRLLDSLLNFLLGSFIQSRGGFVQEQDLRLANQGTGNCDSLLLPA